MAERLGSALQKLLHRFESGSDLNGKLQRIDCQFNVAFVFLEGNAWGNNFKQS